MSAPIMSRFDLFFVVLDECKPEVDQMIAEHIVGTHRRGDDNVNPPFSTESLQRYIRFARTIKPKVRIWINHMAYTLFDILLKKKNLYSIDITRI